MNFLSPIDPHVHLRGRETDINFARYAFNDAVSAGLAGMMEMPNPRPELVTPHEIMLRRVDMTRHMIDCDATDISYRAHIGLTTDLTQVRNALRAVQRRYGGLRADKTFYCHSTGNMGILDPDLQKKIWQLKGELEYTGISIGHFEAEDMYDASIPFDPKNPITHSQHQRWEAECTQVERQLRNAYDAKFRGTFYIAHVSCPQTVELVRNMNHSFRVILETTFHHLFLNTDDYAIHGNRVKMNPPLRSPKLQEQLLQKVCQGRIDIIGSDHAPHELCRKDELTCPPSGIPALPFWPKGLKLLVEAVRDAHILNEITFGVANRLFDLGLAPRLVNCQYNRAAWGKYGYNPFSRIDAD